MGIRVIYPQTAGGSDSGWSTIHAPTQSLAPVTSRSVVRPLIPDPEVIELDVTSVLGAQIRSAPPGRPYVLTNMVSSADGGISVEGLSGGLGGPSDRLVFDALRSVADVVLAGATTVRQERYRPPTSSERVEVLRRRRGQHDRPALAVVTAHGRFDPNLPMFGKEGFAPIILCGSDADDEALARVADRAEIVRLPTPRVSPSSALAALHDRGFGIVLLEGGPNMNGQFLTDDLVDEWNLTIAPQLLAGSALRPAIAPIEINRRFVPTHVWAGDDLLFAQWRRPPARND